MRINREGKIKLGFSLSLLVYAIVAAIISRNYSLAVAMFASSLGDVGIMASRGVFNEEKHLDGFNSGVAMFAVAHCLYISAMNTTKYASDFFLIAMCALIVVLAMTRVENSKFAEYVMMFAYLIALYANTINGFFFNVLAGIGGVLFILSDNILGLFEKKSPKWQIAIWATYVPAQICLITSFLIM